MNFLRIVWDDGVDGNVDHIDEHDLTPADVEWFDDDTILPVTAYEVPEP